jgi:hypothetical protein
MRGFFFFSQLESRGEKQNNLTLDAVNKRQVCMGTVIVVMGGFHRP